MSEQCTACHITTLPNGSAYLVRDCLTRCDRCRGRLTSLDYAHTCAGGRHCPACANELRELTSEPLQRPKGDA